MPIETMSGDCMCDASTCSQSDAQHELEISKSPKRSSSVFLSSVFIPFNPWDGISLPQETMRHLETDSNPLTVAQSQWNEAKPRLGKDEVDILEREFERNPKPTTQTKGQFAEDMGVDLSRINVRQW
jgi:hypothetical protein